MDWREQRDQQAEFRNLQYERQRSGDSGTDGEGIGRGITRPAGSMEHRSGDHRPDGASLRLDLPARHAGRAIRPAGLAYPATALDRCRSFRPGDGVLELF